MSSFTAYMADFILWGHLIVLSMFIVMTLSVIFISDSHTVLTCELFALKTSSPNSSNENSPVSPPDDQGQGDSPTPLEEEEPAFPHTELAKLDDMINRLGLVSYIWSNYAYNYIQSTGDEQQGYWYEDIYLACYSLIVRLHICVFLSMMYYVD